MSSRIVFGRHFYATRHKARLLRNAAVMLLVEDEGPLILDFSGVEAVTVAFADELVVSLVVDYGPRIVLTGMSNEVAETVRTTLARRSDLGA